MRANATLILGVVGSVVTLVLLFEMMRRHHLREKYAVFWAIVALLTLVIAAFPGLLAWLAALIGVQVPANLLFFLASMLLLAVSIQHSHELGRLEERTRTLAEECALLRLEVEVLHRDDRAAGEPAHRADETRSAAGGLGDKARDA